MTTDNELPLYRLVEADNGNCRVYYRNPSRRLMCFLEDRPGEFIPHTCSRDGEPEVPFRDDWKGQIDRLPNPDCKVALSFAAWLSSSPLWSITWRPGESPATRMPAP